MKLEGKIIDFLGDSITEGVGVSDRANNRYDNILCREHKLKAVYNYGIGGTRIAHQRNASGKPRHDLCFCGRVFDLNRDADIVVVYGGVNDYFHGDAPIGTAEDTTPATFCGGVNFLMNYLKGEFAGKTIVFMTPAHSFLRGETYELEPSKRPCKAPDAQPITAYISIIKEAGKRHGIPVLDLFENLGIDPNKPEDNERYTVDGLHFNDEGHKVIAKRLGDFLLSL